MAKMFYTLEEAADQLGMAPDDVKQMASLGKLKQFRDRDRIMFRRDEVDGARKKSQIEFPDRLRHVLAEGLKAAGIRTSVEVEPIEGTNLNRVYVVSTQRDKIEPTEWNALLWRLIHNEFGVAADHRITTIYTLTPSELRRYRANVETARS